MIPLLLRDSGDRSDHLFLSRLALDFGWKALLGSPQGHRFRRAKELLRGPEDSRAEEMTPLQEICQRKLYQHQAEAFEKAGKKGSHLIVASGTAR
jgi:hypothetical protein